MQQPVIPLDKAIFSSLDRQLLVTVLYQRQIELSLLIQKLRSIREREREICSNTSFKSDSVFLHQNSYFK